MFANAYTMGAIYATCAAICFAFWNVFLQRALQRQGSDGTRLSLFTMAVGVTAAFVPIDLWLQWRGQLPPLRLMGVVWFLLAGLMTAGVGPFFATVATWRIGAARTAAVRLLDPFFAYAIAFLFLGESVSGPALAGVALIMVALALLQLDRADTAQTGLKPGRGIGLAAAVAASLCFTLGSVARKSGLLLVPSVLVSSAGEGVGGLLLVLPLLLRDGRSLVRQAFRRESLDYWLAALGDVGGTFFLNSALAKIPVPIAVALRQTTPWFALLLLPLLLGGQQRPGHWTWISTALLTGGMLLIVLR